MKQHSSLKCSLHLPFSISKENYAVNSDITNVESPFERFWKSRLANVQKVQPMAAWKWKLIQLPWQNTYKLSCTEHFYLTSLMILNDVLIDQICNILSKLCRPTPKATYTFINQWISRAKIKISRQQYRWEQMNWWKLSVIQTSFIHWLYLCIIWHFQKLLDLLSLSNQCPSLDPRRWVSDRTIA